MLGMKILKSPLSVYVTDLEFDIVKQYLEFWVCMFNGFKPEKEQNYKKTGSAVLGLR